MSVWTHVEGFVSIRREEHFSLRKYTQDFFGEEFTLSVNGSNISLAVCVDGEQANRAIEKWVSGLPGKHDLTVHVRFIK